MAKSRVEKNKKLYEEIELESFEIKDIAGEEEIKQEVKQESRPESKPEPKKELVVVKRQNIVPVKETKKLPVAEKKKVEVNFPEEDFVVEQPISYTSKLSIEEILRAKLEKQQKLKDSKKGYKKSPYTKSYTPQDMQKNISQKDGIDIRKEANIKVKKPGNGPIVFLVILLLLVLAAGAFVAYKLL